MDTWFTKDMFAGGPGVGAEDAWYMTAIDNEHLWATSQEFSAGATDLFKCFDQLDRNLIYKLLETAGAPPQFINTYKAHLDNLDIYNAVAGGHRKTQKTPPWHTPGLPHQHDGGGAHHAALV